MKTSRLSLPIYLALFCIPTLLHATVEETELAAKLSTDATEFLDQLLGPGRAKVLITASAERTEVRTQSEVTTPILKPESSAPTWTLPGYTQLMTPKEPEDWMKRVNYFQKDMEQSLRLGGLVIKSLRVSVVLDSNLSDTQVNTVRKLLPDLLRMDGQRGDVLSVLRAPLVPMWKRAFLTNEGIRSAAFFAGGAIVLILVVFWLSIMAYVIAVRSVKTLVREIAERRGAGAGPAPAPPSGGALPGGSPIELMPSAMPTLIESMTTQGGDPGRPVPALGRRFDFLAAKPPEEIVDILLKESPEDLALLFGHLADAHPDAATRLFDSLPITLKGEVSQALVRLTTSDPERLSMLENRLRTAVEFGVHGPERLGRILSQLPSQEREEIMGEIMSRDSAGAEKVEGALFPFERIADLAPAELRRLLSLVPYAEWGIALRGSQPELVDPILSQLPAGPRAIVRDAMDIPQPREKIMEARSKILSQVYVLAAKGQLTLGRPSSAQEMI